MKGLLESWGADILGPAATIAEAEHLVSERTPNVAIVDITLRGGEQSHSLIDRLCDKGVRVVVATGDADVSLPLGRAAAILQKPMGEHSLLASLRPDRSRRNRFGERLAGLPRRSWPPRHSAPGTGPYR